MNGPGLGDIGLDDIQFFPSSNCSLFPTKADPNLTTIPPSTTTVSTTTRTPGTTFNYQSLYDCDFEKGICSWQNDLTAEIQWKRTNGSSQTFYSTGPATDHTTQTKAGFFIFLDVNFIYFFIIVIYII